MLVDCRVYAKKSGPHFMVYEKFHIDYSTRKAEEQKYEYNDELNSRFSFQLFKKRLKAMYIIGFLMDCGCGTNPKGFCFKDRGYYVTW